MTLSTLQARHREQAAFGQDAGRRDGPKRIFNFGLGRKDEIGEMAGAVEVLKNNMIETERLRAEQLEAEQPHAEKRKAKMIELADAFEGAVERSLTGSASAQVHSSTKSLSSESSRLKLEVSKFLNSVRAA